MNFLLVSTLLLCVLILARSARSVRLHGSSSTPIASFVERGLFRKTFCHQGTFNPAVITNKEVHMVHGNINTNDETSHTTSNAKRDYFSETIRIKEQPGNENDLEPSTTIAGSQEATKRQLSPPDQVFVNVSDSPYQTKNFKFLAKTFWTTNPKGNKKIISNSMI